MIFPGTKSETMKNVAVISSKLQGFNHFVLNGPRDFTAETYDMEASVIHLTRRKFMVPAPRVWTMWEYHMRVPARYIYYVWADDHDFPKHFWASKAKFETWIL